MNGALRLIEPKSETSRRTLPIGKTCAEARRHQMAQQKRERLVAGAKWAGDELGLVFTTAYGRGTDGPEATRALQSALKAAGLPKIRFHDLRHSFASLLLTEKKPPRVVMELLGHSTIAITMNLYGHVLEPQMVDAAESLDDIFARK